MIKEGVIGQAVTTVCTENTAEKVGSGNLPVFATPAMIALMEKAASESLKDVLDSGSTTVGTLVNVTHIKPTGIGKEITAGSKLERVEGRKLFFSVDAHDEDGLIGEGVHERVIVDTERFLSKI